MTRLHTLKHTVFAVAVATMGMAVSAPAALACLNPTGTEGLIVYNQDAKVVQYCDGTNWIAMGGSGGGGGGGSSTLLGLSDVDVLSAGDGQVLRYNATTTKWESATMDPSVAGLDTEVQFNDGGSTLAGASQLLWNKTDNRLTVGTTTPGDYTLDVTGKTATTSLILKSVSGGTPPELGGTAGGASNEVQYNDGGALAGDSSFVWDNVGKRLGIGTDTPRRNLHVRSTGSEASLLLERSDASANNKIWRIMSTNATGSQPNSLTFDLINDATSAVTTSAMTMTNAGHIGIGTDTPRTSLHVKGASAGIFLEETNGGANNEAFLVHFNNIFQIQNRNSDGTGAVVPYNFDIRAPSGTLRVTQSGSVAIGYGGGAIVEAPLTVQSGGNSGPAVFYSSQANDVFSILPWGGMTYLGSGAYYKNGAWLHDGSGNTNALFTFGGGGASWHASNNGSTSWNVANSVTLWNASGVLVGASSRNFKEGFQALDKRSVLERIAGLQIDEWKYKYEPGSVRHIGPVAEDWHDAFRTGDSDKYIPLIDQVGVTLVGVQALKEENDALKAENMTLKAQMDNVLKRLEALEGAR